MGNSESSSNTKSLYTCFSCSQADQLLQQQDIDQVVKQIEVLQAKSFKDFDYTAQKTLNVLPTGNLNSNFAQTLQKISSNQKLEASQVSPLTEKNQTKLISKNLTANEVLNLDQELQQYKIYMRQSTTPLKIQIDSSCFIQKHNNNFLENYELQNIIGEGSYGKVYKARHKQSDKTVAVKVMETKKNCK